MRTESTVRPATDADRDAILALVRAAFTRDGGDGSDEVGIVEATWALGDAVPDGLELVATRGDQVVGHVLGARADLGGTQVAGIAPLAVAPAHQGGGIGTALMTDVLARAEAAGIPLVGLLGSPAYYGRFGFEASGPLGITYQPVGADNPHFQVRRLAGYTPAVRGDFTYCWESPPG